MSRRFYFRQDNGLHGPVTAQQLRQMAADGRLEKTDYVRPNDQDKWYVAGLVKGLFPDSAANSRPWEHHAGAPGEPSASPSAPPTEAVIDVEAFEGDRKRRLAARRKKLATVAIGGGVAVIMLVVVALSRRTPVDHLTAEESASSGLAVTRDSIQRAGVPETPVAKRRSTAPYVLLRDEVTGDAPYRGQIEIDLLIDKPMSRDDILELLRAKFNEAIRRKAFARREYANCVIVSAFSSIEHWRAEHFRNCLAQIVQVPASDQPRIDFNDVLHKQMFQPPETRHGLSEATRREIYRGYLQADWRGFREAEKEYPTDPDLILRAGDSFYLDQPIMLMGTNNAEEWFARGCPSMEVPTGTKITVMQTVKNDQGTKYTQVAANPPNEHSGYKGWIVTTALGYQHPILKNEDRRREQLELQGARAQELKKIYTQVVLEEYGISQEVMDSIYREGSRKQWPD